MSRAIDARKRIADALEAADVRVAIGGQFAAPAVLLEPGDPWIARERMGRKLEVHYKLTAIAARSDTGAAYDELGQLADDIDRALRTLPGVQLPTWGAPHDLTLGNVARPACTADVAIYSEET
jgi:hypothetical protein